MCVIYSDSIRTMMKYGELPVDSSMTLDAKLDYRLKECRGQRNFYISGFTLFLILWDTFVVDFVMCTCTCTCILYMYVHNYISKSTTMNCGGCGLGMRLVIKPQQGLVSILYCAERISWMKPHQLNKSFFECSVMYMFMCIQYTLAMNAA